MMREKNSVAKSRRTCSVSLYKTAPKPRKGLSTGGLLLGQVFRGELDEDVFEAGSKRTNFGDHDVVFQELRAKVFEIKIVIDQGVNRLAKDRRTANAGDCARGSQGTRDLGSRNFHAIRSLRLHLRKLAKVIGRAVGDDFAEVDVGHMTAAFRLVHVMSGYKEGDAVCRK